MRKSAVLSLLLIMSLLLAACSNYEFKPETKYVIDDFSATNQHGDTVSLDDLKGKPWLAMFMFTNCTTICSPMTYNMTKIQKKLIEHDVEDYNIVAFSVDPARDTPEVLTDYFSFYEAKDESKWHFLTGYDQAFIEQFAVKSFKSLVKMPSESDQVIHANTFYLVDEQGIAVKNYAGYSDEEGGVPIDTIAIDMKTLIKERLQ
ncbi:MAG: SCO family protein [Lysinibacillus sp.]